MKNKTKGFTLAELLVAVVLVAVLVTLGIMTYTRVNQNILEEQLENKLNLIEINAVKWAEEQNLSASTIITIKHLIDENYLQADEYRNSEPVLDNPVDKTSLLCYTIIIEKDGEEYTAEVDMEAGENCDLQYSEEMDDNIKVSAFAYENGRITKAINNINGILDWVNKDILLVVTSDAYQFNAISFTPRGGSITKNNVQNNLLTNPSLNSEINPNNYANTIIVSADFFLDDTYTIGLYTNNGVKLTDIRTRIDKEMPKVNANVSGEWTQNPTKAATINGSDGNGSGLQGFYISKDENTYSETDFIATEYSTEKTLEMGTYYIWAKDNVGNVPDAYQTKLIVSNIDNIPPIIHKDTLNITLNEDFSYKVSIDATDNESGILGYYLGNQSCNTAVYDNTLQESYDYDTSYGDYNLCVKDQVGNVSQMDVGAHLTFDIDFNKVELQNIKSSVAFKGNLIFVLDVSGSMSGGELTSLKQVTRNLVSNLKFNNDLTVSVIAFQSSARTLISQSRSQSQVLSAISGLSAGGGTNFNAALTQTSSLLSGIRNGNPNYVIFLSDGYSSSSTSAAASVKSKATVYTIGFGSYAATSVLTSIASKPSNYYSSGTAANSLTQVFADIITDITQENAKLVEEPVTDGLKQIEVLRIDAKYPVTITVNGVVRATYSSLNDVVYTKNGQFYFDLYQLMKKLNLRVNDLDNIVVKYFYEMR